MSSASDLEFETKLSDEPLIYVKKSSCLRNEQWGTSDLTVAHAECWPFKTTLCFLSFKTFPKVFS